MIGVQQQLLQTPRVPQNILRNAAQGAMSFVDEFHLSIASLEDRNALEHRVNCIFIYKYNMCLCVFFIQIQNEEGFRDDDDDAASRAIYFFSDSV